MFKKQPQVKTVQGILAGFSTMVADLRAVEAQQEQQAQNRRDEVRRLADEAVDADIEANKARIAADKIEALIGGVSADI